LFRDRKLQLSLEEPRQCAKAYGKLATPIQRRLVQLRAAEALADVAIGNPHPLTGNRSGQYSVTVSQNYRLIFEPADDPLPTRDDGTLDPRSVRTIRIVEVVDYHE
jgi:toxin HigB-1